MESLTTSTQLTSLPTTQSYWCFSCEKEFAAKPEESGEVFCKICGGISELIDPENDPRKFEPYDARKESSSTQNTTQPTQPTNTQQNPNPVPQMGMPMNSIFGLPMGMQTFQAPMSIRIVNTVPLNGNGNAQGQVQQTAAVLDPITSLIDNFMGGIFGANSAFALNYNRLIQEFISNDPNNHGPPPASDNSIKSLKKIKFDDTKNVNKDCAVCQEDFKNGEELLNLPCTHCFHPDCVTKWLTMHNSCPTCRKPIPSGADGYSGYA